MVSVRGILVKGLDISKSIRAPSFSREVFIELMKKTTKSVEFSFNNVVYRQINGVAMGSPLGPALANNFVGYYNSLLFRESRNHRSTIATWTILLLSLIVKMICDKFLDQLN